MFDRDEHFRVEALDAGYRIHSEIVAVDASYRFRCVFDYDADWLPQGARAEGLRAGGALQVAILPRDREAVIELRAAGASPVSRSVALPEGCLIDLEPSALPMWAMTRRYDRMLGGVQHFQWIGRSLTRDLVLEGGRTALSLSHADCNGERFEFTEELPAPDGTLYRIEFRLANSAEGWFHAFEVSGSGFAVRGERVACRATATTAGA